MFTQRRRRPAPDADDNHVDQMLSKHVARRRPLPLGQASQRRGMDRDMQPVRSADKGTAAAPSEFPREMDEERKSDGGFSRQNRHDNDNQSDGEFHFGTH